MINKAPFINKYKLSQKTLFTLNIYKIVIRLKSQVLRKEDSRLEADRQMQIVFCSCSKPLTLFDGQTRSPPELPGGSKVTTTYFLCVEQFGLF